MSAAVIAMLPKGRQRSRAPNGSRAVLRLFPKGNFSKTRYWLYAVGFEGGIVKLGRSAQPRSRFGQHWSNAQGAVAWLHLFGSGTRFWSYLAEAEACRVAGTLGERVGRTEWFNVLTRENALLAGRRGMAHARLVDKERELRDRIRSVQDEALASVSEQIEALRAQVG